MATTTNFGWNTPDDTDLVKDGALAIRTLGSDIDTALVDLKGGSTGQSLVKNSGTDLDFAWASNLSAGKNKIINGDFSVWQRGTTLSGALADGVFLADRWRNSWTGAGNPTSVTVSREAFTPAEIQTVGYGDAIFYQKMAITTVGSSTAYRIEHRIENVQTLAGQPVTVSFWCKADEAHNLSGEFNQIFGSGGSTSATKVITFSQSTTPTSWTRITGTATLDSMSGKTIGADSYLQLRLNFGTDADGDEISIWGVQVEAGSVATAFQTATGTIQGELAACQRYYYRLTASNVYGYVTPFGTAASTTAVRLPNPLPVNMRVVPTSIDYADIHLTDASGAFALTALTINSFSARQLPQLNATVASGLTQFRPYALQDANVGTGYLGFSAEL